MPCHVCQEDKSTLYVTPDRAMLVSLCDKCRVNQPTLLSVPVMTPACRACSQHGKCCRTNSRVQQAA